MHTYTVMEFFTDNPILFIALIIFALFWIGLAILFITKYLRFNKSKENIPKCKPKSSGTV